MALVVIGLRRMVSTSMTALTRKTTILHVVAHFLPDEPHSKWDSTLEEHHIMTACGLAIHATPWLGQLHRPCARCELSSKGQMQTYVESRASSGSTTDSLSFPV